MKYKIMKNGKDTFIEIIISIFLIAGIPVYAQNGDCKVNIAAISGSYSGGCKNGLAHGKGIAQGTDHYEGQFTKGMPEGKGRYTWSDGSYYEGQWRNGLKEGKGMYVTTDSVVTGYWQGDVYMGEKLIPPYKIISILSVTRYTITKISNDGHEARIKILQGGADNTGIEDFSMAYDSGNEYRMGNTIGIQNVNFPLDVKIKYRTWNQLHTTQYDVTFEFSILQPGTWNVMITN